MDKTFIFKDNELRITDTFLEIDLKEFPHEDIEKVTYKPAAFGTPGELRVKPKEYEETAFSFKYGINREVSEIAAHICKKSAISLHYVKKGRSKILFLIIPVLLAVAAAVYVFGFYGRNGADGAAYVFGDTGMDFGMDIGMDFGMDEGFPREDIFIENEVPDLELNGPSLEERLNAIFSEAGLGLTISHIAADPTGEGRYFAEIVIETIMGE